MMSSVGRYVAGRSRRFTTFAFAGREGDGAGTKLKTVGFFFSLLFFSLPFPLWPVVSGK
jgi:hypothetical protein